MEMQFFVNPSEDKKWFDYWKDIRMDWFKSLGMNPEKLRFHDHDKDELAHYAKGAVDIEYEFPFGWGEMEGIHNRTDFDLTRHQEFSGKSLKYFDAGVSRSFMAFLVDAYYEEEVKGEQRVVLRFHPRLAPVKAAIFPLVKKDGMPEVARKIEADLRNSLKVFYDDKGAVGRRYRRQDEAGTPYCITVDNQTMEDQTITVRERDSMEQERVSISKITDYILNKIHTA